MIDSLVNRNLVIAHRWQTYFTNETQHLIKELDNLSEKVGECLKQLVPLLDRLESEIQQSITDKEKKPFSPIEKSFVDKEISDRYNQLKTIVAEYNKLVETLVLEIDALKRKSQDNQLVEELERTNAQISESNINIKRYELSSDIDKLLLLKSEKETIETKFKKLQKELEKRNEEFIKEYFQDTTRIFNKLGSVDFEIQPTYQRWGGQPVYNPTIKFANEEITNDRLPFVFSDADRRALAFSIFLARLKKKTEEELKKPIVVLDDPVTSFDDNRISETFIEIKNIALSCRQLIIAAHHSRFLLDLYERLRNNPDLDIKFIEITRQNFGSVFKNIDDPKITLDPHAREIEKIERFIEGDSGISASDVRRALRPILQKEWRFRKQLKGLSFKGLGELVDKLVENDSI